MDKITEAAKAAGGTTYTNRHYPGETACAFGPEALDLPPGAMDDGGHWVWDEALAAIDAKGGQHD
jgi:hypothetical protein